MALLPQSRPQAKNAYEIRARYKTNCKDCSQYHGRNAAGLMVEHFIGKGADRELCVGSTRKWSEHKKKADERAAEAAAQPVRDGNVVHLGAWILEQAQRGPRKAARGKR